MGIGGVVEVVGTLAFWVEMMRKGIWFALEITLLAPKPLALASKPLTVIHKCSIEPGKGIVVGICMGVNGTVEIWGVEIVVVEGIILIIIIITILGLFWGLGNDAFAHLDMWSMEL